MIIEAKEINIKSFSIASNVIPATMQRLDMNGDKCALVKVVLPSSKVIFEGNVVGNCEYKAQEYWCYLTPGTKYMKIKYPGYEPLMVGFVSFIGRGLESDHIYEMVLDVETFKDDNLINFEVGHEYVDLGLRSGVKWATCNLGASSPEENGDYFAWGETQVTDDYFFINSKTYGYKFDDIGGNDKFDAARAKWGGAWRLPTEAELIEIRDHCTWTWTVIEGHGGYKVTGPNGNFIFLPAGGYRSGTTLYDDGLKGYYWSSSPNIPRNPGGSRQAYVDTSNSCVLFFKDAFHYVTSGRREEGRCVRPVFK